MSSTPRQTATRPILRNIMVSVDLDLDCDSRLKLVRDLADRYGSSVLGTAAREIVAPVVAEGGVLMQADLIEEERRQAQHEFDEAEALFRRTLARDDKIEWRSAVEVGSFWLCQQARSADLVVCGARPRDGGRGGRLRIDPADVVMNLGRPLLVVPPRTDFLPARRIVVGWKNSREARRAVADALPFLVPAESVLVAALGDYPDEQGAKDVAEYLRRYGIDCEVAGRGPNAPVSSVADELWDCSARYGADLVVCGAYGHSRLREWMFGGVTKDVLDDTRIACLLSH
ncbi:universal stress protein [Mangrovicella endophytica]|uniref:universal stress protein n=1 Tax=Mangrovicella endophytica TaxID=2066697 RepID=UPI0013000B5B|nr:universal stress protein [Mangrovicella endophytica]